MSDFKMPEKLGKIRDKLANEYRDKDFELNPRGYEISKHCNEDTTSDAFAAGFNACAEELLPIIQEMREALEFYESRKHILTEYLPNKIENGFVAREALEKLKGVLGE